MRFACGKGVARRNIAAGGNRRKLIAVSMVARSDRGASLTA
jgi:hypothetical protein